jgi:hypothetical protein
MKANMSSRAGACGATRASGDRGDPRRGRQPGGLFIFTRDITERRNAQASLERVQEQLAQSQKMEALGQLKNFPGVQRRSCQGA